MAKISVIILNYQTPELTIDLLKSLDEKLEIIVVDNSPEPTLAKLIKKSGLRTRYFFTGKNLGFAGGNNFGLARSAGEWIFFLNSDTRCAAADIVRLKDIAEENNYQVAAPKIVSINGQPQKNVGFFDSFWRQPINCLFARPRYFTGDSQASVDFAHATALMVKRSIFESVGLWDEKNYFMYFEDIDLGLRLHKQKIPILFVPEVKITHLGGESFNGNLSKRNEYYFRSLDRYLKKNRGPIITMANKIFRLFR
jgi:GT2 family glycosyltransferase